MVKIGEIIAGNYKITGKIGSGGGGDIFSAVHLRLGTNVVLKRIKDQIVGKIANRSEADIIKGLKHSYLPQIYDFIDDENGIFTVMDYIEGESLATVLRKDGFLSQNRVIKYLGQLCEVVDYLHSRQPTIIHSDIKPANIMITPEDNICLIDFNISLVFQGESGIPIGATDGYAPPEQYSDEAIKRIINQNREKEGQQDATVVDTEIVRTLLDYEMDTEKALHSVTRDDAEIPFMPVASVGPALDIYSIGATAWHMITGERPPCSLLCVTPLAEKKQLNVGPGIQYLVDHAMEKARDQRFESVSQMLHIIRNIKSFDARYKRQRAIEMATTLALAVSIAISLGMIGLGLRTLGREKNQQYQDLLVQVEQSGTGVEKRATVEEAYAQAIALFPTRPDAYLARAVYLFDIDEPTECVQFSTYALSLLEDTPQNAMAIGDFLYLMAECSLEEEKYADAVSYSEAALAHNAGNGSYYLSYAIALARMGDTSRAQAALEEAVEHGVGDDSIYLIRGEISLGQKQYDESVQYFESAIQAAETEDAKLRGVQLLSRLYRQAGGSLANAADRNVQMLNHYLPQFQIQNQTRLQEELAQAYVQCGQVNDDSHMYQMALNTYNSLWDSGDKRLSLALNMAALHEQLGQYTQAETLLDEMADLYPENHLVYIRKAFLEADIQGQKDNGNRDYTKFDQYCTQARENAAAAGAADDMELQRLEALWQDVQAGGWL